jgi:hypothetical protein
MMIQGSDAGIGLIVAMFRPVASSVTRRSRPPKNQLFSPVAFKKYIFWRGLPSGRQIINSTGELWHSRTPTNEFGCHGLAGGILRISSSSGVRTVYRHIPHRAAPRPPGCKGGSVVIKGVVACGIRRDEYVPCVQPSIGRDECHAAA